MYELPNPTLHASGILSLSTGSNDNTADSYLGSHTLIHPSLPAVTNSGAPFPQFNPPTPSIAFTIFECAFTLYFTCYFSKSIIFKFPIKSKLSNTFKISPTEITLIEITNSKCSTFNSYVLI